MNQSASFPSGVRGGAAPHAPLDSTIDRHFYEAVIQRCVNGVTAVFAPSALSSSESSACEPVVSDTWASGRMYTPASRVTDDSALGTSEFPEKDICICGAPTWSGYTCRACS